MLKQSVRKTNRKPATRSLGQLAKARSVKGQMAYKQSPFAPRIETFLNNLESYANQRKKQYGANDAVYKELSSIRSGLRREMRKQNPFNPNAAKTLCKLSSTFKQSRETPSSLREGLSKLCDYLCKQSQENTVNYLNGLRKELSSFQMGFERLHQQIYSQTHRVGMSHTQWAIDPALRKRASMMMQALVRFRTKWLRNLTTLNMYAEKNIQSQVRQFKDQLEEMQKTVRKHQAMLTRYGKTVRPKAGYHKQHLISASQVNGLESNWKQITKGISDKCMQHCHEWSRAAKHF